MISWFDLTELEILKNPEAAKERQLAYYNTFYANVDGRLVMSDLRRRVYASGGIEPVAIVALIDFLEHIRKNCGLKDERAVTDAESGIIEN